MSAWEMWGNSPSLQGANPAPPVPSQHKWCTMISNGMWNLRPQHKILSRLESINFKGPTNMAHIWLYSHQRQAQGKRSSPANKVLSQNHSIFSFLRVDGSLRGSDTHGHRVQSMHGAERFTLMWLLDRSSSSSSGMAKVLFGSMPLKVWFARYKTFRLGIKDAPYMMSPMLPAQRVPFSAIHWTFAVQHIRAILKGPLQLWHQRSARKLHLASASPSSRDALLGNLMLTTCRAELQPTPSQVQMSSAPTGSLSQPVQGTVCWYQAKFGMAFRRNKSPCWSGEYPARSSPDASVQGGEPTDPNSLHLNNTHTETGTGRRYAFQCMLEIQRFSRYYETSSSRYLGIAGNRMRHL